MYIYSGGGGVGFGCDRVEDEEFRPRRLIEWDFWCRSRHTKLGEGGVLVVGGIVSFLCTSVYFLYFLFLIFLFNM